MDDKLEEAMSDPTFGEGVVHRAMDNEGLTFGEAVAMLFIIKGEVPFNNNPGAFKGFVPIKD
ncbi:hypothetical protein HUN41_00196 [Streptomyces phage Coruscant]|uniref:Uncharacterized protein n=1 Tax=Streptomyces phage Coruscant TaxID=2739834 RepID=A0A7G4AW99_9CAUD|nr:hypothetical protein PP454_gp128 [Streptomyces phage Coruscant]QMP84289.1 hypothetical protein HUN41_00196 [Streptomyces phage Coruscant]